MRPLRLRVETTGRADPYLLRAAIAARLEGRQFPSRGEDEVARRVAQAVHARLDERGPRC
jgi:hypothetical protein